MKIGIEAECLSQTVRGIGYFTLALIEALKEEQIVCFHTKNAADTYFPEVSHRHFRKHPRLPFSNSLAALTHSQCFDSMDILHFPEPKILYGKKPKAPFVLTIHDVMPLLFPEFFPKKSYLMMRCFLPKYLKEAAAICAVSGQTKKDLLKLFPIPQEKVHVIPCSLLPKERVFYEEKEPFLFYIGSFEPRKNLKGIIEAFAIIKGQGFPHKLVLAGKEEGSNCLPHDLIRKLKLENEITLKGYISEDEKTILFQRAALLVWPSFYEGFGIPLLEAMASGTPIVTSNCSAPFEIVKDAAICVDPHDPVAIANGIAQVLSSKELTKTLMQKGLKRAEDFSLDTFRKKHLELYNSICALRR